MLKERKFTILNVFDTTIGYLWKFCLAWKVWVIYTLVLTAVGALSGNWTHTCKDALYDSWWCVNVSSVFSGYVRIIIYFIAAFFLVFAFCFDIYHGNAKFLSLFSVTDKKLKFMGFAIGLCSAFFAFLAIGAWLVFRKANPDWLVEFGFFLIVFTFSTLAVLILRTSASLGLFLQNGKIPNFKQLFNLTHGKFYVVLLTFCIITYAVNILQMNIMRSLEVLNMQKPVFYVAILSEFFSSLAKFFVLAVYTAYFLALAKCLVPEDFIESAEAEKNMKCAKIKKENVKEISKKSKRKSEKNTGKVSKKAANSNRKIKNKTK